MTDTKNTPPQKAYKLEIANEMFKTAFQIKKHKFRLESPELSESEVQQKTADYFKNLPKDD